MMTTPVLITLLVVVVYVGFHVWYGGRGKPLSATEIEQFVAEIGARIHDPASRAMLEDVRMLVSQDDGREFVMQNLACYRSRALYPPGAPYDAYGEDARAADRRYGRAIVPRLLRYGNIPIFIARRSGRFIEPQGAPVWDYVAMVRYRSRRDFLRFALAIERDDIAVHKWAALETTHVFPVSPLLSLFFVRGLVATLLAAAGLVAGLLIR